MHVSISTESTLRENLNFQQGRGFKFRKGYIRAAETFGKRLDIVLGDTQGLGWSSKKILKVKPCKHYFVPFLMHLECISGIFFGIFTIFLRQEIQPRQHS